MERIKEGSSLITRALNLEKENRLVEALSFYQEGIQICMDNIKDLTEVEKPVLRNKIERYITRAEKIKDLIDKQAKYHKEIVIKEDATGFSYETVFGNYLNIDVSKIIIEDSYIQKHYQLLNFLRFCELAVKKCENLRKIVLVTRRSGDDKQELFFTPLSEDLRERGITLKIQYSETIHDRKISLNNGWIFLPGRGLDYFKPAKKFSLGYFDMDLRLCHETKINIHCQSY